MDLEKLTLRRATLDDLDSLRGIWALAKLNVEDLEKRFTEFQIAIDENDSIVATIGLYHTNHQGLIHSEVYVDLDWEPALRAKLSQRIMVLAKNYGVLRLWTQSSVSFWRDQGWKDPDFKSLQSLPPIFGHPHAGWLTIPLINDSLAAVEKQFEILAQAQRENSEKSKEQARRLKMFAAGLVIALTLGMLALAGYAYLMFTRKSGRKSNSSAW